MSLWSKKSLKTLQEEPEEETHRLKRVLDSHHLITLGIGAIIGAGLFSITGIAAAENAGPAIVIAFIIAAIGCAFAGLCYSEIASMIPVAGSAYTYCYATMGELMAWIIGWDLVLEYAIGAATVSISWSGYVVALLQDYNIHLPQALIASPWQPTPLPDGRLVYGMINLPALLVVAVISFVLILGIKQTAIVNTITAITKLIVVILFIILGAWYINPSNYHPFIPENTGTFGEYGWSGILRAAGIVFFAYIGFDAVSTAAQEAKNPQKSMPIGIMGSLIICTLLYIMFAAVMTGLVPFQELKVAAPVAVAINQTPFTWLNSLIKLAIIAGLTSVILVMLLGQSRIFYAMSRDGFLPRFFCDIHTKYRTPWRTNLIMMVFVGFFGAFAPISMVGSMTSIGTLLAFSMVCAGVLILRYTQPNVIRPFKTPWVPLIPLMGIAVCFLMMASLGLDNWLRLLIWLGLGMAIYMGYGRYHTIQN